MTKQQIFGLIGFGLAILGGASGVALFFRAVIGNQKISEGPGMSTLWGLFVVGLLGAIIIFSVVG